MKIQTRNAIRILIPASLSLLVPSSQAFAQNDSAVEIFGGYFAGYSSPGGLTIDRDATVGVRASHLLTHNIAVEGAITRTKDFFTAYNYELSAKAFVFQRSRTGLFVLAGLGDQRVSIDGSHDNVKTLHAGIGVEIGLTDRFYLRPQVLARWPTSYLNDTYRTTDYTVGFGWRF